jgi:uncharacterized protein
VGIGYANDLRYGTDFVNEYLSWQREAIDLGFRIRTPQAGFHCDYCSLRSGRIGAVANADGTLYSCWETVGRAGMEVGDVRNGYLPDNRLDERWHACGYNAAPHDDADLVRRFHDRTDAELLDLMRERALL